jgi:nuclear autoantigenic sperm protein
LLFESASKVGDAIQYCAKAIALCKSRLLNLKNAVEASLADDSGNAFVAEDGSENSTLEDTTAQNHYADG